MNIDAKTSSKMLANQVEEHVKNTVIQYCQQECFIGEMQDWYKNLSV